MKTAILLGSIRPGRRTERFAKWVLKTASESEGIEAEIIDLKDYQMPFFDEAISPRFNPDRKPNETAKKFLDKLKEAESLIVVTPEYDHSIPGVLMNALDYVDWQLDKKPVAIVSHGTVGGARAAVHLREIISEIRAVSIPTAVAYPSNLGEAISEEGVLSDEAKAMPYGPQTAVTTMLDELKWYSDALSVARSKS